MNCERIDELLGAYALDALPEEERREVDEHLAACELHAEAAALRAAANALALTPPAIDPDPALRSRILSAITGDEAAAPPPSPLRAVVRPLPRITLPYALAAALAIVAGGLLAWNIVLQAEDDGPAVQFLVFAGESGTGTLVVLEDRDQVVLILDDLPLLGADQDYQVWAIVDGAAESLGVVDARGGGRVTVALGADLADLAAVAVSVEPAGGSEQPTTTPILTATF